MNVLVIAPHPDDETLGCGGTLLKHKHAGDQINWAIVTRGHEPTWSKAILELKENEIASVNEAYGFSKLARLDFPTVKLDTVPLEEMIKKVVETIDDIRPDCVYLNHAGDIHSDHRIIFDVVLSALKPFNTNKHGVRRILSYETLSSTDAMPPELARFFVPNVFNEISSFLKRKLEIMSLYKSEIQPDPLPRSLESLRALARVRGTTIGAEAAEAFMLIRDVCGN